MYPVRHAVPHVLDRDDELLHCLSLPGRRSHRPTAPAYLITSQQKHSRLLRVLQGIFGGPGFTFADVVVAGPAFAHDLLIALIRGSPSRLHSAESIVERVEA